MDDALFLEAIGLFEDDPRVGQSSMHKHMVRAVYLSLRKKGKPNVDASKGAFKITNSVMKDNGYQGAGDAGKLTGIGARRSRVHAAEPSGTLVKKATDYKAVKKMAT